MIGSFGLSQRRASGLVGIGRNTLRSHPRVDRDESLRARMKELADRRRRFGCRRLHILLRREALVINHKRTERVYQEEHLSLHIRRRKKRAAETRVVQPAAQRSNELWAMDFLSDALVDGRRFRVLPIIDTFNRECLWMEVDTSIGGKRVAAVLSRISALKGLPQTITVDNGPEFISNAMDAWAHVRGIKLQFSRPGKPVDNAFMESFNGKFRDECLNENWFFSLDHARQVIEEWRIDYNRHRPHSSLGDLSPEEFMRQLTTTEVGAL